MSNYNVTRLFRDARHSLKGVVMLIQPPAWPISAEAGQRPASPARPIRKWKFKKYLD